MQPGYDLTHIRLGGLTDWVADIAYRKGDKVLYGNNWYECNGYAYQGDPPSSGNEYPEDLNDGWIYLGYREDYF